MSCVVLFISLGLWQLDRGHEKEAYVAQAHQLMAALPQPFSFDTAPQHLKPVFVEGWLDARHIVYIDNQLRYGRSGYDVVQRFCLKDGRGCLWLNRGWLAAGENRSELPAVDSPRDLLGSVASLHVPAQASVQLGANSRDKHWPRVVQWLDIETLNGELGVEDYPAEVRLSPESPIAYHAQWPLSVIPAAKHYGYALQWFVMALACALLQLVKNTDLTYVVGNKNNKRETP